MTNGENRLFQRLKQDGAQLRRRYTNKAEKRGFHKGQGRKDSHKQAGYTTAVSSVFSKFLVSVFFF